MNPNDTDRAREELERALGTGDPETIVRTVLFNAWPLYSNHYEFLLSAIATLPNSVLMRNPLLRIVHPMTAVLSRTSRASLPPVSPDEIRSLSPGQVDLLTLGRMVECRLSGDEKGSLAFARQLAERVSEVRVETRDRTDGPLWFYHHQIGSTFLAAGDTSRALLEFSTARQLACLSVQPDAERSALGRAALAHAVRGSLGDAERALSEATDQPAPSSAHANSTAATESAAAALISVDRMAEDLDDRLAQLEPYDSIELTWPFALLARTRALLARNHPDEALEAVRLSSHAHAAQRGSFASDVIAAATVEALTATGETGRARTVISRNTPREGVFTRLASVRLALHEGDFEAATRAIRAVLSDPLLGPGQRAECSLLSAWLEYARTGELDEHTAMQVARLGSKVENRRIFASVPDGLIEQASSRVPAATAASLSETLYGLSHVDVRPRPQLTRGERRVLEALSTYETTAAIAKAFDVSPNTIKSQLHSLYRKLGCSSREAAIQIAQNLHLVAADRQAGDPQGAGGPESAALAGGSWSGSSS